MKFSYGYKTSQNETRDGVISASSRDDAFRKLKAVGIRPFRVDLAPGLMNRIQLIGKRGYVIVVLAIVAGCFAHLFFRAEKEMRGADALPRHQIYGDPAVMREIELANFSTVFDHEGERFLACYAIPGYDFPNRKSVVGYESCLEHTISFVDGEPREVRELKQIVNGMKEELRAYLSNGKGTPETYVRRLNQRLGEEKRIYLRVKNELEGCREDLALWERRNRQLREIGLKTIERPGRKSF